MGVSHYFEIQKTTIRCKTSGSEFIFKGLNGLTIDSIKSLEGADICWIEEAHSVSEHSWQVLIPTIRKAGSRILITFNPDLATDPVYKRFVLNTPPKTYVFKVNYLQNPDCPQEVKDEANYLKRVDYESYAHIWLGEVREHSDAQIFKGKYKVESFDVDSSFGYPLLGADWGFAQDPNTLVKVYIKGRKLYIRSEVYRIGCEIEDTPAMFDQLQDVRSYTVRADSARPELVKYMQVKGFKIVSVDKWSGSVEDGISFMRSFEEIVIHSDCPHTAEEFRLYSYKIDKRTGDVLPDVVSLNDHCIDSIRYALQPMIRTNYVQPDYFM
jgi:phage terminase large subunit